MPRKPLRAETDTLLPERDAYHVAIGGNLYLINFDVNKFELKTQHKAVIKRLVVPFIEKSVRRFGPGEYELHVIGSASATGTWQHDKDLADARASEAGNYAIKLFRERQIADPTLKASLFLDVQSVGKTLAVLDPLIVSARTKGEIEKRQPAYRSVLFFFKAGFTHPAGASTFHIREHYVVKFSKIEESIPDFLKRLEDIYNKNPLLKQILSKVWDKIIKPFKEAIGGLFSIGSHMVVFLYPQTADYAYELKDYRSTHALYRYHTTTEHSDTTSLMELLGLLASLAAALKTISDILSLEGKVEKWMTSLIGQFDSEINSVIDSLRPTIGDQAADAMKDFIYLAKTGQLRTGFSAPSSPWQPFVFYDGGPDHNVVTDGLGSAVRTAAEALLISTVDLQFGGPVPNNWTAYNAEAFLKTVSLRNSALGAHSVSNGTMNLIKGPYFEDLTPGPFDPITDKPPQK